MTLLAQGTPMLLMGDEVRRTQHGNNNAYCHDNETSWFDWRLLERHGDVRRFVERLVSHRLHLVNQLRWHDYQTLPDFLREARFQIHGVKLNQPDWSYESHSLAINARGPAGGMFHIMINAYREALAFELPPTEVVAGWRQWIDTSLESPDDICEMEEAPPIAGATYLVQSHSIVCLLAQLRATHHG
jgi:glycogen operon protein